MVKKTSILERLKGRWKTNSGMHLERGGPVGPARDVDVPLESLDASDRVPATPMPDAFGGRKLSTKEEAVLAVREGLHELSDLLRGVSARMDDQGDRQRAMATHVEALPSVGKAQLEVLGQMMVQLQRQNEASTRVATALQGLPDALQGVQRALDRAAVTDERTAATLGEFRATMERIQTSMQRMVDSSAAQAQATQALVRDRTAEQHSFVQALRDGREREVQALATKLDESRREDVAQLAQTTRTGVESMQRLHDQQVARLDKLTETSSRWGQLVVVLLTLSFFAVVGVLAALLLG